MSSILIKCRKEKTVPEKLGKRLVPCSRKIFDKKEAANLSYPSFDMEVDKFRIMINAQIFSPLQKARYQSTMEGTKKWMSRIDGILEEYISDPYFNNDQLANELSISERNLFRKVNELTGMSPQKYIRSFRLNRAMNLLIEGEFRTVKETAFAVGYLNVSYFISQFEKVFGRKPLQVLQEEGWR